MTLRDVRNVRGDADSLTSHRVTIDKPEDEARSPARKHVRRCRPDLEVLADLHADSRERGAARSRRCAHDKRAQRHRPPANARQRASDKRANEA